MISLNRRNHFQTGSAVLLYVTIVAIIAAILMAVAQSRLILALRRTKSSSDSVIATYKSESLANDYMARLIGGYLSEDIFPLSKDYEIDKIKISVKGEQVDEVQTIAVTTNFGYATSTVEAKREILSLGDYEDVDIVLALDCTGSMNAGANCASCNDSPTRLDAQKEAAIDFVNNLSSVEDSDKFRLGVMVFGIDTKWLEYGGADVTPNEDFSFNDIKSALQDGFSSTREDSIACQTVMDATSVGSPYTKMHEYYKDNESEKTKQIEIVITDGTPNTRIPEDGCPLNVFCPGFPKDNNGFNHCEENEYGWECYRYDDYKDNYDAVKFNEVAYNICEPLAKDYLRCVLADEEKYITEIGQRGGIRNPEVDAYAVTIYSNPPGDVVRIFKKYATPDGYFNASHAGQLSSILEEVLLNIITERSVVTFDRLIPS